MATPILTTKLHIPSPGRAVVPRRRLIERLDEGLARKLTLVSAPAGFGKTTLLGEWLRDLAAGDAPRATAAWISLDEGDNDPARLAAYLAAALGRPGESHLAEPDLVALINDVAARPHTLVLVLDDYHAITSQVIHDALAFLVDHLPDNLHLVLAGRADPPLPLPRLRARGHLAELRQADLRFTTDEAAALLNDVMGLGIAAGDVAALETRTEGWIAGLQMAILSLQGRDPGGPARSEFIRALTGSHRFVLDYMVEEVLDRQPPDVQAFLLQTSIFERLTGPLCDHVLAGPDGGRPAAQGQAILERLEAANLFIVPLDDERRWYRYHRLFSDLLRKRLGQTWPERLPELHRRASAWHEQQGLPAEAIEHALAAEDFERAAALVEDSVEATLMRSEVVTFLRWIERLPDECVRSRPSLCFFHAWALSMSGRSLDAVEEQLQAMARAQPQANSSDELAGRTAALRAYLAIFQADMPRAAALARQALQQLPERDRFLRSIVVWILSLAGLYDGDLQDGKQGLEEVARVGQEIGSPLIVVAALCHQARLHMRQGQLAQARDILERALRLATDRHGQRLPIASEALLGLGELEWEWDDLPAAAAHLAESIELSRQWSELSAVDAYLPLARIRLALGDAEGAREAIDTARHIAARSALTEVDDLLADLQQAHFFVIQGDLERAARWAEARGLLPGASPESRREPRSGGDYFRAHLLKYEQLVLARLLILQGRPDQALELLEPLLALARRLGRVDLALGVQILRALACQAAGHDAQALAALADALAVGEPGGYVRTFVEGGEPLARLLCQAAARGLAPAYTARLLAAFGRAEPQSSDARRAPGLAPPLAEPLTERELEVLRLLAAGLSNPEIAAELVVAASTVRSHCKSIYGKLDAHTRQDAVRRGREMGLM